MKEYVIFNDELHYIIYDHKNGQIEICEANSSIPCVHLVNQSEVNSVQGGDYLYETKSEQS